MNLLADLLSTVLERRFRLDGLGVSDMRPFDAMIHDLMSTKGETSGMVVARQILERFAASDDAERLAFFKYLAEDMSISAAALRAALTDYEEKQTKVSYRAMLSASEAPRQELIRRLNQVPGATRALVEMRTDLLRLGQEDDALQALDLDFRHLFASWFNRGFLVLRPITWESPAHILEKIIAYEAVHAIDSWNELRRRVEPPDRRCFAFFHPAMPDEPLIFVEVALTQGIPGSIHQLLAEGRDVLAPETADTAVFYSISNCQVGLSGISFGNSLIKQVVADLAAMRTGLKTFVTLSPIPGFRSWLKETPNTGTPEALRPLAAHYLLTAKRADGAPVDPVARFHLGNGALVHQVHEDADMTEKGLRQSCGMMVNYRYDLSKLSQNHERFVATQKVAASSEIRSLSKTARKWLAQEATG